MSEPEVQGSKRWEFFGGAGLGLLVGVLLGMSVTEVVGGVITALMALLATYLGLKGQPQSEDGSAPNPVVSANQAARLGAFAILCTAGVLGGVFIRAHNFLGKSVVCQMQELRDAGFPDSTALALVAYKEYGIKLGSIELTEDASKKSNIGSSVLFTNISSDKCGKLNPASFQNDEDLIHAWRIEGDKSEKIADSLVKNVSTDKLRAAFQTVWEASCK